MDTVMEQPIIDFGPSKFGVELLINPEGVPNGTVAVVDVETDELDNFVGIGIMCDSHSVSYYSVLTSSFNRVSAHHKLVTTVAQEPSNLACLVIMVYRQSHLKA